MPFVSSEHSRQKEVTYLLKSIYDGTIYDGTKKMYPNGSMMLFIPHSTILNASIDFKTKILFNHNKFIGDETLFSIGELQDLNSIIKLKNGKLATLRMLLKSIPASEGMSHPQLWTTPMSSPIKQPSKVKFVKLLNRGKKERFSSMNRKAYGSERSISQNYEFSPEETRP